MVYITKKCKHCEQEFKISQGEFQFYKNKNFELPKLCPKCRHKKKIEAYRVGNKVMDGLEYEKYNKIITPSK